MISLRPLTLTHPPSGAAVSVPVPDSHDAWMSAETLRDAFGAWLERDADAQIVLHPIAAAEEDEDDTSTPAAREARAEAQRTERDFVLLALFLRYVVGTLDDSARGAHNAVVLHQAASYLLATYLAGGSIDLHNRVKSFEPDRRRVVIRSWSETDEALRSRGREVPVLPVGKLFAEAVEKKAVVEALFGGQGTNETYFDELQVRGRRCESPADARRSSTSSTRRSSRRCSVARPTCSAPSRPSTTRASSTCTRWTPSAGSSTRPRDRRSRTWRRARRRCR